MAVHVETADCLLKLGLLHLRVDLAALRERADELAREVVPEELLGLLEVAVVEDELGEAREECLLLVRERLDGRLLDDALLRRRGRRRRRGGRRRRCDLRRSRGRALLRRGRERLARRRELRLDGLKGGEDEGRRRLGPLRVLLLDLRGDLLRDLLVHLAAHERVELLNERLHALLEELERRGKLALRLVRLTFGRDLLGLDLLGGLLGDGRRSAGRRRASDGSEDRHSELSALLHGEAAGVGDHRIREVERGGHL